MANVTCKHCGHTRSPAEEETAPAWACPACGKKYYEKPKQKSLVAAVYDAMFVTAPERWPLTSKCKACREKVSREADVCPHCGHSNPYQPPTLKPFSEATTAEKTGVLLVSGLVIVVFASALHFGRLQQNSGPQNSPVDGSVYQVKAYLQNHLRDPDSYQPISWSKVRRENGANVVAHRYRSKNGFGGYVIEERTFVLDDSGTVISISP